jgi:hypothetical protein
VKYHHLSWFAIMPNRTFTNTPWFGILISHRTLNPCLFQISCKDDPLIKLFHCSRLTSVCRYFPSAIKSYNDDAGYRKENAQKLSQNLIPTQISSNEVAE